MKNIAVEVVDIQNVTPLVKQFTLMNKNNSELPSFSGGSHIVVSMNLENRLIKKTFFHFVVKRLQWINYTKGLI